MKFISTRGKSPALNFSSAMMAGLAPDGGLYVPEEIPQIDWSSFRNATSLTAIAYQVLAPFFVDDLLQPHLKSILEAAFDFPLPLRTLKRQTSVLELFHGPTCAFKDFGARFLAECMTRLNPNLFTQNEDLSATGATSRRTILVATSGDTGGAVAAAFYNKEHIDVGVLFPKGKVSLRQEKQLTCWGGNIQSFAVRGTFDDCQRMVKAAFQNEKWQRGKGLTSANSINIGRLLPQITYYAAASLWHLQQHKTQPSFIVPSGNLGNAVGGFYAKRMGFPIDKIVLATNQNQAVTDYFASGEWRPRESVATLANAMDVGNPSNLERLLHLYPKLSELKEVANADWVSDQEIRQTIQAGPQEWGEIWCPHTATAVCVRERLGPGPWIVLATAHPAKFESVVEPLIGHPIKIPPLLLALLKRPSIYKEIAPDLEELDF